MTIAESFGIAVGFRPALVVGLGVALVGALVVTPRAMRKLRGAGIAGIDRQKPDKPSIPEMGGLAVFLALNMGAFATLALGGLDPATETLVLASLVVAAGACITGVLDDLVALRQRFKAIIPFAFAAPLALYAPDTSIAFPIVGAVDFGLLYPLVLVPVGIACAANGFNMLEGFNGLGAGVGIVMAGGIAFLAILHGNLAGLALLFPLLGALAGFLWYNAYPARVFPGDTMTLLVGSVLASAAMLSKVEFWAALLFLPHTVEFFLKLRGGFKADSFASSVDGGVLKYDGPTQSLTHVVMRRLRVTEPGLVVLVWVGEASVAVFVIGAFALTT